MFEIGGGFQELLVILVVALLVVGPRRLPEVARALARAMRELRRAQAKLSQTLPESLSKVRVCGRRAGQEDPDLGNFRRLLRLGSERRKNETESKNDREPDPPHGHLVRMAGGESSRTPRYAPAPRPRAPGR